MEKKKVQGKLTILSRKDYLLAAVCFLASFLVYIITLAPTVTGEDAGELITAAYTLGIAHPPGYPVWCLLGKVFTALVPVGNIAYRINLMSAFFASGTVFLVSLIIIKLSGNRIAGLAGGLALAFSADLWSQSSIAEVYTLNAFFISLAVFILIFWGEKKEDKFLYLFCFVYALSLCNHHTMAGLAVVFIPFILYVGRGNLFKPTKIITCFVFFILGLSFYLYLPLRSRADGPMDWGNPENLERFKAHVLRKQYPSEIAKNPRSFALFLRQLGTFSNFWVVQFTPFLLWLAFDGIYWNYKKEKEVFLLLLGVFLITTLGIIFFLNFRIERQDVTAIRVFYIPGHLMTAIWIGLGIDLVARKGRFLLEKVKYPWILKWAASGAVLLLPLFPLAANFKENDKSEYYLAYDYGINLFETMDKNAIIIPSGDHNTFPLIYLQSVEGVRPDVEIADKYGYIEKTLYENMPENFQNIPSRAERRIIEKWIIENNQERPIYFTMKRNMDDLPHLELKPVGLAYKVIRKNSPEPDLDAFWEKYKWHDMHFDRGWDYAADMIVSDYHYFKGLYFLEKDASVKAMKEFEEVAERGYDVKEVYNNLASAMAERGLLDEAIEFYKKAIALSPGYFMANFNLAYAYKERGYTLEAVNQFEKLLRMAPEDFRPYRELGFLYLDEGRSPVTVIDVWSKSLRLNPNQPELMEAMNQLERAKHPIPAVPTPEIKVPPLPTRP